jgi:hypothetical protein
MRAIPTIEKPAREDMYAFYCKISIENNNNNID